MASNNVINKPCGTLTNWTTCKPWDMANQTNTNALSDAYMSETLAIAGAPINIHKLLGVHEQTKLVDIMGNGNPISGGDAVGFGSANAFDVFTSEWRSKQSGPQVINSGYIGYDFGIIKLPSGRQRYGIDASVRYEITTIKIKQSSDPNFRVLKARVERSDDGINWFGVAIILLPNNDELNMIHFKNSAPSRYWRLRPLEFNGDECGSWGVQALELYEYTITDKSNIQDKILMENRDRDYEQTPVYLKGYYELVQANTDLQRMGIELQASYSLKLHFNNCVIKLGRPVIIGDIIELPSETQYNTDLQPILRYLEVTDVTWDPGSYTPGWIPTMLLVTALPALASQETQDIFGDLAANIDSSGLFDKNDGNNTKWQDKSNIAQAIKAKSLKDVPERGSEGSNTIREFEQDVIDTATENGFSHITKYGLNKTGLYVEDAIPQNGAEYTESDTFPTNPIDGDYHRLVYTGLAKDVPARLYRYSVVKSRWIYLETDRRQEFNNQKAILEEYTTNPNKIDAKEIK